jgi:pimeloyl-ACP methyl ester carboxylesterase
MVAAVLIGIPLCAHARPTDSSHFYKSFDGVKIHYELAGRGPAVVLLHGFTGTIDSWKRTPLREALLGSGFTVVVPDMRGNGLSDRPHKPEAYECDAEARDIMGLVRHLKLKEYVVVGYSRGSIIASRLLLLDDRVSKAVLGGMGADFTNPEWPRRLMFYRALMGEPEPSLEGFLKYVEDSGVDRLAMAYLQRAQPSSSKAELSTVRKPTLVICGDRDSDNGSAQDLAALIPSAELRTVPGDHGSTSKSQAFADEVMRFIALAAKASCNAADVCRYWNGGNAFVTSCSN